MVDSNVVTFGPNTGNRDEVDEALSNEVIASSSEKNLTAERMVSDAKVEMKFMVDKCFSDFSERMDSMLAKFDHHMTNKITPILGRGYDNSSISASGEAKQSKQDLNNSHFTENIRAKHDIKCKIKPQLYDGLDDLEEYLTQFYLLAELNDWDLRSKALLLASSLTGSARALLNEMTEGERHDFECLVTMLKSRFGSINRSEVFRAELQTRVRLRNESLPELAQAIKKLTRRAYPGTSPIVRDTLALDYFIDAITETDIRLRLREVGPKTIYEAENIAVRLEALRLADRQKGRSMRTADACDADDSKIVSEIKEIKLGIRNLQNDVGAIKKNNTNGQHYNHNNNNGSRQQRGSNNFGNRNFNQNYNSSENYQASSAGVAARPQ
ncbi:unnamed protein product [Mytilus coruscus]|uniref:Retrotransposon gag domain-containing protein n=1 Tax=Mytilus coruscus TaxID=42192 RepID=A0A6J8DGD0_MYTCO|nr:unnamed protein product [Mytilus coruscus]